MINTFNGFEYFCGLVLWTFIGYALFESIGVALVVLYYPCEKAGLLKSEKS